MHAKTMPVVRPPGSRWAAGTLMLLVATIVLAGSRPAPAQPTTLNVGQTMDISQVGGNEYDPSIAINPLNPSFMAVVSTSDATSGLVVSTTTDGTNWTVSEVANGNDNLTQAYGKASAAFDSFGNLFLAYTISPLYNEGDGIAVAYSTDYGQSFNVFTNLAFYDVTDQPRITAPPTGAAAGTVWLVYKDYTTAGTPLVVQGMLSKGHGKTGAFGIPLAIPNSANGGFPSIAVGPLGQAMVAYQDGLTGPGPANIWVSVKTNAFANGAIATNAFPAAVKVPTATDAIGAVTYPQTEPTGIGLNAAPGVAWNYASNSASFDKAYLVYCGYGPQSNLVIDFMSSANNGSSWGGKLNVNDDTGFTNVLADHFLPSLAVDPATGLIGCSWYDTRNDLGTNSLIVTVNLETNLSLGAFPFQIISNHFDHSAYPYLTESWSGSTSGGTLTVTADDLNPTLIQSSMITNTPLQEFSIFIGTSNLTYFEEDLTGSTNTAPPGSNVFVNFTGYYPWLFTTPYFTNGLTNAQGKPRPATNRAAVVYAALSFDGGNTFSPNQLLIPASTLPNPPSYGLSSFAGGSTNAAGWGRYTGLAAYNASFFPVWADNSDAAGGNPNVTVSSVAGGGNPDGALNNFDIYIGSVVVASADLAITVIPSENPVGSGEALTYTLVVTNTGPKAASPITLTNLVPTNVTLLPDSIVPALGGTYSVQTVNGQTSIIFQWQGSLAPGNGLTSTFRVVASSGNSFSNVAIVYSPYLNLVPANTTNVLVLPAAGEDLGLGMETSETNVLMGDTVFTWISVTNFGPDHNGMVYLTNVYGGSWNNITVLEAPGTNLISGSTALLNLGTLSDGSSTTVMLMAVVGGGSTNDTQTATVTSQAVDPNPLNNAASITFPVSGEILAVGMFPTNLTLNVDQPSTYSIYVTNLGLSYSGAVTVSGMLSSQFQILSASQSQGNNSISGNDVSFSIGVLGAGEVATMSIYAMPLSGPATATNYVLVSSTDKDPNTANTLASSVVTITSLKMISNVVVIPSTSSAIVVWDTALPTTGQLLYGFTTNYGLSSAMITPAVNHHVVYLTGLAFGSNYYYEVESWLGAEFYSAAGSFNLSDTILLNTSNALYTGLWTAGSVASGLYPPYYQYSGTTAGNPTSWAFYDPTIPADGLYNVFMWHPQDPTFTTNAQVYVTGGTNAFVIPVDETTNGGAWQPLATNMYFTAGTNGNIMLFNGTGETNKNVVANAFMWVYNPAQDYPTNGSVPPWWANFYFGTNVNGYVNGAATNASGYSYFADYVFGTDPTNPSSHVVFNVAPAPGNQLALTFSPYVAGRAYQLQVNSNFGVTPWTTLTNVCTVNTNGSATFTISPVNAGGFYRLSAQVVP